LFSVLEKYNASAVLTDVSGHRNLLHMHVSSPQMMVRWVGNDLHPTDFTRLNDWFQTIRAWKAEGVSDLYFFTHEPDNIYVPEIASYFISNVKNVVSNTLIKNLKWRSDGKPLTLF